VQPVVPNPPSAISANRIRLRLLVFVAIRITRTVKEARRLPQSRLFFTVHRARHAAHNAKSFRERKISCNNSRLKLELNNSLWLPFCWPRIIKEACEALACSFARCPWVPRPLPRRPHPPSQHFPDPHTRTARAPLRNSPFETIPKPGILPDAVWLRLCRVRVE
jgi:hypothetical protein